MLSQASLVRVSVKKGTCKGDRGPGGGQRQHSERLAVNFPTSCIANARQVPKAASSSPQEGWLSCGHARGSGVLPLTAACPPGGCPFHSEPAGSAQSARQGALWALQAPTPPLPAVKGKLVCVQHQLPLEVPRMPHPVLRPHSLPAPLPSKVPRATGYSWWLAGQPGVAPFTHSTVTCTKGKKRTGGFSNLIVFSKLNTLKASRHLKV